MKKLIISALCVLFAFAAVNAQKADTSMKTKTYRTTTKSKRQQQGMTRKSKQGHSVMHPGKSVQKQKTKSTSASGKAPEQQPAIANTTVPKPENKSVVAVSKGNHYTVKSNGKKAYVKTHS